MSPSELTNTIEQFNGMKHISPTFMYIRPILAGDLNGHVGESQIGFERWHGGFSIGERNEENILHLAQAFDLAIVNTVSGENIY